MAQLTEKQKELLYDMERGHTQDIAANWLNEQAVEAAVKTLLAADLDISPEARQYLHTLCATRSDPYVLVTWAQQLGQQNAPSGVNVGHDVPGGVGGGRMNYPPVFSADGTMIKMQGDADAIETLEEQVDQAIYEPFQQIHEVVRLHRRGLVVIDADADVFVLTNAEWGARDVPSAHRKERLNRILDRIAALPEPAQSEAIGYFTGVIDALRAA